MAGYCVTRMARLLFREMSKKERSQWPSKTELLLVGLQSTDALFQAPLAQRLSEFYGDAFVWLSYSRNEILKDTPKNPEEVAVFDGTDNKKAYHITSDEVPAVVWRRAKLGRLADAYTSWTVAGIVSRTVKSSLSRSDWFDRMSEDVFCQSFQKYERWRRFLDAASPLVIGALSTINDMAFIRSWARRNGVPFVLFPHGVFQSVRSQFQVDGDYLGVFGKIPAKQVHESGIAEAREVALCGSMQFGAKQHNFLKNSDSSKVPDQRSLLYVTPCSTLPFFPHSLSQRFKEIETLHRACRSAGCELVVREHPRGGKDTVRPFVEELDRCFPGTIRVSEEPSLFKDFSSTAAVVTSNFDGAVLDALLSGKIVVAYLAEHSWNPSLDVLEKIGCFVRTEDELERVLCVVLENGKEIKEIRRREQEFLAKYIEEPGADPWARAEELLAKVLQRVQTEQMCN